MSEVSRIGIVGAGMGGIAAAALLQRAGFDVILFDQSPAFSRLGAGIQFGPNVMKILRRLDLEAPLEAMSCLPDYWMSRKWDDGEVLAAIPLNAERERYHAPYITIHRGDLQQKMLEAVATDRVRFGRKLVTFHDDGQAVSLEFEDGTRDKVDILIAADGINSRIREILFGQEEPVYTGWLAHRAIIPGAVARDVGADLNAKWWSEDRHIVCYYLDRALDEFYLVTGEPGEWTSAGGQMSSTRDALRESFRGYHPMVQAYIDATEDVTKWPLKTREPLPVWHRGRVVLLGDSCHPMKPHMAQGAAMAVEDAAVLTRCLTVLGTDDLDATFRRYHALRKDRATKVQSISNANTWLRAPEDPFWCYGDDVYDMTI
ncbi:FAD-dependent monooxygenase [Acidomonas methanolica]|uniref:Salicylate 1-monooxygenase n=1 Tax=Acidomonas methanolica NBRC 104435 TaxID=1231351 RepID=A0A023D2Y2_ACIMT|nr:FAD-dependent monooxygenase [Acidomonas methanolica]MBU2654063.1 FAD-dependent monooxygenase [Acidomonas methanolica]TCS30708.1 6-hydroxynicotinate 3-monooxygenase [Acidomonas methanolica]GAJ28161.1 salicylate 1-monooxygenase [Acidomonas methanolica NBRC 104435]GBQ51981.1 salicylate 1-monooxygenase [Acidomonas methanolica]GEK98904.1 monooxygenase [Acidomonas methanolica NBRC 104435]